MANMDDGGVSSTDAVNAAFPKADGKSTESINFKQSLDLAQRVATRGLTDPETVPSEGRVPVLVDCIVDVAVVAVVDR